MQSFLDLTHDPHGVTRRDRPLGCGTRSDPKPRHSSSGARPIEPLVLNGDIDRSQLIFGPLPRPSARYPQRGRGHAWHEATGARVQS